MANGLGRPLLKARALTIALFAVIALSACASSSDGSVPSTVDSLPSTVARALPEASLVGEKCVGDRCKVTGGRWVEFDGEEYFPSRKIGYAQLGDDIAKPRGVDVDGVAVRSINGIDPQIAIAVTGDGLNAVRYDVLTRIGRVGPLILRLTPDDPFGDVAEAEVGGIVVLEDGCLYLADRFENPSQTSLGIWPSGTIWHPAPRSEIELRDGAIVRIGDRVLGSGGGSSLERLTRTYGDNILEGCTPTSDSYQSFHSVPEVVTHSEP